MLSIIIEVLNNKPTLINKTSLANRRLLQKKKQALPPKVSAVQRANMVKPLNPKPDPNFGLKPNMPRKKID